MPNILQYSVELGTGQYFYIFRNCCGQTSCMRCPPWCTNGSIKAPKGDV